MTDKPMSAASFIDSMQIVADPHVIDQMIEAAEEWAAAIRADERAKVLEDADKLMANWCRTSVIKLAAGEMTAQELRTAQAVVRAVRADLSRLAAFERQSATPPLTPPVKE